MRDRFEFNGDGTEASFAAYVELYGHGSDVSRGDGAFEARVRGWRMDSLLLFDRWLNGVVHSREARAAQDGFDHFVVTLVVEGELIGSAASGFDRALPGDIVLADTRRASRTEPRHARLITVSVARDVVEAALGGAGGLHGRRVSPPVSAMLGAYMQALADHAETLAPSVLPSLCRAFIEVLSTTAPAGPRGAADARRQAFLRREYVERHIAAHLAEPDLSVATISDATGISRSALYRLFEKQGGVARLIRRRRLDAVRAALDARDPATLDELAERFGLAGGRLLGRQFLEAYGVTPGAYRKALAALDPGAPADSRRRWTTWMTEVA